MSADKLHVQGVLVNLLDNSLKYCSPKPLIEINLLQKDRTIGVVVSDNGPGIPDEYLDKIFDKFFRVPSDNRHNIKGYGLGLSYVSMVMKKHNGVVTASNRINGGSSFTLTFPAST